VSFLDDFLVRAALAGVGAAAAAGPLGCFVVWRRMAYFGDATAHAAILGVALALAAEAPILPGVLVVATAMAAFVSWAAGRAYAMDTLLGVASHAALALGLVAASFQSGLRLDLSAWLFGDVLAVGRADVGVVWAGAAAVLALLAWRWRGLVTATLSPDLAAAEGVAPARERLALTLALAVLVAVALKVVGALLITALLIIPAAAARACARTPEAMAIWAAAIGGASALAGLAASYRLDTPAGPSIVTAAVAIFVGANAVGSAARALKAARAA
jgi:zinc transport system permease protein